MASPDPLLTIGRVAQRTGLSVSAIRFYEERGLLQAERNAGGQRRFRRSDLRRLSFILAAQKFGFSIKQIAEQLAPLPLDTAPTKAQWEQLSKGMREDLNQRIEALTNLRDKLDGCIGCGCLSLENCAIYNPEDSVARRGPGPQLVFESGS